MQVQVKTSSLYTIYNQRRDELLDLATKQAKIVDELKIDEIQTTGTKQSDVIRGLVERLQSDKLRVLVVGRFSAGKSTFINSLLGTNLLPSTPTPTTGVLCKINYAEERDKKVTLYPKEGMGLHGNDEPFDIGIDELKDYIKIDHINDSDVTSRYKRMELLWPLALCANGVELIDSVGLDDPDSRDEITLNHAQSVDAVLYLMKSQDTASKKDLDTINLLRGLGYESLFFVITYYDHVKESALMGEQSEEQFQQIQYNSLSPLTELGSSGVKFVDSRAGLLGRMKQDERKIAESGIEEVEKSLESFLVEQRGKAKLVTTLRSLRSVNRAIRQVIPSRMGMLQKSNEELERWYEEAKIELANLEMKRQLIVSQFDSAIQDISREAYSMASPYFQELATKIPEWGKKYKIESGVGFPPTKKSIEPVIEEVINYLKGQIETDAANWTKEQVTPMMEAKIQEVQDSLESEARNFIQSVDDLRISISVGEQVKDEDIARHKEPNILGRIIAGGLPLLTGDVLSAGLGATMGIKAMLNTLMLQLVTGFILGLLGFFNPITLVAASISCIIGGGFFNLSLLKQGIKKEVGKKMAQEISNRNKELAMTVEKEVQKKLGQLKQALNDGLAGEISSVKDEAEKILNQRKQGKLNTQKEIEKLTQLQQKNLELDNKLDTLMCEAGII